LGSVENFVPVTYEFGRDHVLAIFYLLKLFTKDKDYVQPLPVP